MEWHWTILWKSNDHEPLMGSCRVPSLLQFWNSDLKTIKRQKNQIQNNQTTGRPLHNWDYISSNELCLGPIVVFTIIDYLSLGVLTSNQVAVNSNLHIAPTSKTIIPPTSHSAFQKWDTTRYTYCPSFMNVLCDRLNSFSHWLPLLSQSPVILSAL